MSFDQWAAMAPPPAPSEIVRRVVWGRHRKPWYRQIGRELSYLIAVLRPTYGRHTPLAITAG